MSLYSGVLRPVLFRLSPDRTHAMAQTALRWSPPWRAFGGLARLQLNEPRLRTRFGGVDLPNPIGLAAGFDKDCDLIHSLSYLGFGFLTVGSIMPGPRPGNAFPRLVRYPESQSLVDSMGLPSKGRAHAIKRLRNLGARRVPIFANIGGFSAEDIARGVLEIEPYVDAVEISLMCPNIKPGEHFDELRLLAEVLQRIEGRRKPVIVRTPNDTARSPERMAELVERCVEASVAGLKVGGGRSIREPRLGAQQGTAHGRMVFETAVANVAQAAAFARGRIPIKGNGGIASAEDVLTMLHAGAVCVDLYSAFIFQGWGVAKTINTELLCRMNAESVDSLGALAKLFPRGDARIVLGK